MEFATDGVNGTPFNSGDTTTLLLADIDELERSKLEFSLRDSTLDAVMVCVSYRVPLSITVEEIHTFSELELSDCKSCEIPDDSPFNHVPGLSSWDGTAEIRESQNPSIVNGNWWLSHGTMVTLVSWIIWPPGLW